MTDLWESSLQLMLLGMGTVFIFLTLLVIATTTMSTFLNKFAPPAAEPIKPAVTDDDIQLAVAAAAAFAASQR